MPRLPDFENEDPIFEPRKISNTSSSTDEFAAYLGKMSQDSLALAKQTNEEESKANSFLTQSQMQKVASDAQVQVTLHPDQATQIAQNTSNLIKDLNKNAKVNKNDRFALNQVSQNFEQKAELAAAKAKIQLDKTRIKLGFIDNLPELSKTISSYISSGKIKEGHELGDYALTRMKYLVSSGMLNVSDYRTFLKTISGAEQYGNDLLTLIKSANPTPAQVQQLNGTIYGPVNDRSNLPSSEYTQSGTQHLDEDTAVKSVLSQLTTHGHIVDLSPIASIQKHESFEKIQEFFKGANTAQGMIAANAPSFQMQARLDELKHKDSLLLTHKEKGEKLRLEDHFNNLGRDYVNIKVMQTAEGARIKNQYLSIGTALNEKLASSAEGTEDYNNTVSAINYNNDNFYIQLNNLGYASHDDIDKINAYPQFKLDACQSSFNTESDPNTIINVLNGTSKELIPIMVSNLKETYQQSIAMDIANADKNLVSQDWFNTLVQSNQDGVKQSFDAFFPSDKTDKKIMVALMADDNISTVGSYKLTLNNGFKQQTGMYTSYLNAIKMMAMKAGDRDLNHLNNYISYTSRNVSASNNIYSNNNKLINAHDFKGYEERDFDLINSYAIFEAKQKLKKDFNNVQYLSIIDNKDWILASQPNGYLALIDGQKNLLTLKNGQPLFLEKMTDNLLSNAKQIIFKLPMTQQNPYGYAAKLQEYLPNDEHSPDEYIAGLTAWSRL